MVIEEFNHTIEHRSKTRLKHADALSRAPIMYVCNHLIYVIIHTIHKQDEDEFCRSTEFWKLSRILKKFVNGKNVILVPESI